MYTIATDRLDQMTEPQIRLAASRCLHRGLGRQSYRSLWLGI